MIRTAFCAILSVPLLAFSGCRTSDGEAAATKDVLVPNGQFTRHYYAVGEEARRALCPFGIDSEDPEAYRAQCEVTRKLALEKFTENLEGAFGERFHDGGALSDEENRLSALTAQSLGDPAVLQDGDVAVARFVQVLEQAFGIKEEPQSDGGGSIASGADRGTQILTASFGVASGISVTPAVVAQVPVSTNAVTVRLNGCKGRIVALATAASAGQPLVAMDALQDGEFKTADGTTRKLALIQLAVISPGGFCQAKVTSAGLGQVAVAGAASEEAPGPEAQVGVLQYNGGFVPQLVAPLNPPQMVKEFRVAVPEGCEADVVKGGILTTQQVAPTTLLDAGKRVYRVNGGAGTVASGVSVSLNGPLGFCQIPIFAR